MSRPRRQTRNRTSRGTPHVSALARSRRHRFAPMLLLAFALLVVGGAYTALAPSSAQADALDEADAGKGEALFIANCATCHGPGAVGTDLAPSLVGVGPAAVHFQVTTGRMPMQASGPQAEAKPPQFSEDEARSEEHTSELQSRENLVCRLLLEKKKKTHKKNVTGT